MRDSLSVNSWPGRVLLVAMVLVTAGVGWCCTVDDDHHGGAGPSLDLCSGLAIFSVAAVAQALVPIYPLPIDRRYVVHAIPLHRLDPPPKSAPLS